MGGIFGRKKKTQFDPNSPFFDPYGPPQTGYLGPPGYGAPPPYPYGGSDPYGRYGGYSGYGEYDPMDIYGYSPTESFESFYGGPQRRGRGPNMMSGMSPWNYGNFYMGNTTMQMMPMMQRKVAKFAQRQLMSGLGGSGGLGGLGGFGGCLPMMPMMPMMPCLPASCCMPMASPMMAAATPLPIAYNPIVQGMYPMAGTNCANWMTPSSFMSALTTGPMPYRPPASMEFPNNISMVMTLPYGAPNPLLSLPSFGGFSPQYTFGGGMSCCCSYCLPSCAPPPAISYYPRPVSVPQPYPVPVPTPIAIPNVQQVPIPRQVSVVAPPIVAGGCQPFSVPAGAPLLSSQGGFVQGGMGQQMVMGPNRISTTETLLKDETSDKPKRQTSIDQARRAKAQKLAASLSNLGLENNFPPKVSSSRRKHHVKSHRKTTFSVSDIDHITSDTLHSLKRSNTLRT